MVIKTAADAAIENRHKHVSSQEEQEENHGHSMIGVDASEPASPDCRQPMQAIG